MRSQFMLADGYINFNHGSYGCIPKPVYQAQQEFVMQQESRPDPWFRGGYQSIIQSVRAKVASCAVSFRRFVVSLILVQIH